MTQEQYDSHTRPSKRTDLEDKQLLTPEEIAAFLESIQEGDELLDALLDDFMPGNARDSVR